MEYLVTPFVLELMADHQILEIILEVVEADIKMAKQGPGAVVELDMYLVLVEVEVLGEERIMVVLGALEEAVLEILIKKQEVGVEALERLEL